MKRIIYSFVALTSLFFVSCKKFLTADSPSNFSQGYIFSSVTDAKKSVNSVYALFNQDAFTSRLSNNFAGNTDVEVGPVGASPDNSRRDIWSFETTPSNNDLLTVWNNAYNAINRANENIEGLTKIALANEPNNPEYKQLLGEVKTLRAYWYYMLMNHWGDVPFKVTPSRAGDDFYLPRTGRDSILTYLINDLREIEPDMKWADQLDYGIERVNREFVIGFIARLALMRGGYWLHPDLQMRRKDDYLTYYQIANTYAKKLTELKPRALPDFATVFMNQNKYIKPVNSDVLWEVAFHPGYGDVGWSVGVVVTNSVSAHAYGATTIQMFLTPNYYHSFDTTDQRLRATNSIIAYNDTLAQIPTGPTAISINKWNRLLVPAPLGPASAKGTGINWPMMRYSDVLLMLAESENELNGPTGVAQEGLRKVRQRAFPSSLWGEKVEAYIASVSSGKAAFFDAIVNERAWEFGGEFLRKYDLIRWNLYGKKVAQTRNTLIQMGQDAVAGTGPYSHLAEYQYYKRNPDKTITFLNRYLRVNGTPPSEYNNQVSWLRALWNTTTNSPADYILRQWRGYQDVSGNMPLRYILPLHSSVVTNSKGVLQQQYGY